MDFVDLEQTQAQRVVSRIKERLVDATMKSLLRKFRAARMYGVFFLPNTSVDRVADCVSFHMCCYLSFE